MWFRSRRSRSSPEPAWAAIACEVCGQSAMIRHCPPRNRCGWLLCDVCGARHDPRGMRWVAPIRRLDEQDSAHG